MAKAWRRFKRRARAVDVGKGVRLLPVLLLFVSWGCASARQPFSQENLEMRDYKPLSVPTATPVRERWEKLQKLAAVEAWHLQTFDEARGLMIAARMFKDSREIREQVRVVLRPSETEIAVQTEVLEDGEWDSKPLTRGRYEYSRETEIATKLDR